MLVCPECGYEYRDSAEICPECNVALIPKKEKEKRDAVYKNWEVVFTAADLYEAEMVKANLESADIEAVILDQKDKSFNVAGDLSVIKIMVPKHRVDDARAIIEAAEDFNVDDDEIEDDFDDQIK